MLYYIGMFGVLASTELILTQLNIKNRKKIFLIIAYFMLSLFSCFRDFSVGTDTQQFVTSYNFFSNYGFEVVNFNQIYEPGFMLYMILLSRISASPRFFIVITYLFINFGIIKFINDNSKDYFISIIIYIFSCQFLASMTMLRQFMAISIVFLFFRNLLNKKYFRFLLSVFIAMMFHYFAILFVLLIPIYIIKKLNKAGLVAVLIALLIFYIFLPDIVMFLLNNISNYNDYIAYLESVGEDMGTFRLPPMLLVLCALLMPYIVNFKRYYYNETVLLYKGKNYGFLNLVYLLLFCLVILSGRFGLFTRVYYYFTPFLVLIPNIFDFDKNKDWRLYTILMCLAIFITSLLLHRGTYGTENFQFGF